MKIGVTRIFENNSDNFTTNIGISIRRTIYPLLKPLLKLATKRRIIVEHYPNLKKGKPYIFASTHYFDEDIIANLATLDRNAWSLAGSTNQIENNPLMIFNWLTGIIYVDRLSSESRKDSIKKMKRILSAGSSVILFPEGGWNNSENLLVQKLFSGAYYLSHDLSIPVVPISVFHDDNSSEIYIYADEPLLLFDFDKQIANTILRDTLATNLYKLMEEHSKPIYRSGLSYDLHLEYMEKRKKEYMRVHWTRDVWEEELTSYKDKCIADFSDVYSFLDYIEINKNNAYILAPLISCRIENEKYDFKKYMHENWNK